MIKSRYFYSALLLHISSVLAYLYLSLRTQTLKVGQASSESICQLGDQWNCDVALTSPFAEIFGLPLSHIGFAIQFLCLGLLILLRLNWLSAPKVWSNWIWKISLGLALASVFMLLISLAYLDTFCPICTFCYATSWLILWPLKKGLPSTRLFENLKNPKELIQKGLYILVALALFIFLLQAFLHKAYPVGQLESLAQSNFIDWKESDPISIPTGQAVVKDLTPSEAKFTLIEFVDFLCGHCKNAHTALNRFLGFYPTVRVELMHFPLDPRGCTQKLTALSGVSTSCFLAKANHCAFKQGLGFKMADYFFSEQSKFQRASTVQVQSSVNAYLTQIKGNNSQFNKCLSSKKTARLIAKQKSTGEKIGIRGTPALFVDKKSISASSLYLTLTKIYEYKSSN